MKVQRSISIVLAFILAITMMPGMSMLYSADKAYADSTIGSLNGRNYNSFESLTSDLASDYKNKSVKIEMKNNWNAAGSDDFDRRLVIPSGCTATLNMHGFVFNRNRAYKNDSTSNGEMIYLDSGSTLIINGGDTWQEKQKEHGSVAVYTSTDKKEKPAGRITTYGGTITGGCNTYGSGGIHIKSKCTLTMNDVTIAGCSSRDGTVWNGFGGGIYVKSDYSTVRMNNSVITGCYADVDGGGIYTNEDPTAIELSNSRIEKNFAYSDGGGMYLCDEKTRVTGTKGSKITGNVCGKKGGGILTNDNDISVTGLEISGNRSKDGAGIYSDDEKNSFSGLIIKNNNASERGGGIYIDHQENSIASCEITGNKAGISGGGVYVGSNVHKKFNVTGKVIVRDNTYRNFYMSDSSPEDNRVNFNLTKDSDVRMAYYNMDGKNKIMVTDDDDKSPDCTRFITAENSGCTLAFDPKPDQRKIYYIRGAVPAGLKPTQHAEDPKDVYSENINGASNRTSKGDRTAGKVGKVGKGGDGEGEYDLIRAFSLHEETDSDQYDSAVAFYYSDGFFDADPMKYNPHLATTSLTMAYAGMYLRAMQPEDESGNYYYNRHAAARQFMADIGCPDQRIYINDSNEKKPETDSIGVTIASKDIDIYKGSATEKKTLIPIVVRGGGYELEWASNATLGNALEMYLNGKGLEAKGFSNAADQVESEIDRYIAKYGLEDEIKKGNVIFWISGYSRAGATSNLTAKRLVEKYADGTEGKDNKVFAYTCEAPMGGTDDAEKLEGADKQKYYCIHNIINAVDVVPHVAPQLMGFKRYGVDHYVPGTDAGSVTEHDVFSEAAFKNGQRRIRVGMGGPLSVTVRRDNNWLKAKGGLLPSEIPQEKKNQMLEQLKAVDSGIVFDDYFHPMAMNFFPGLKMYENGDYWGNDVESFVSDFLRFAQEGTLPQANPNWSQAISDRDMFAFQIQQALRDSLAMVFTMDAEHSEGFVGRASSIMDKLNTVGGDLSQLELYQKIIGSWHDRTDLEKRQYITLLWKKLEETGAFDYLSESDRAKLENNWPALANFIFRLVDGDYDYKAGESSYSSGWAKGMDETMTLIPTFATFATYILQNHYPEVNLAWARVYDSYYTDEKTEYMVRASAGDWLKAPAASGKGNVRTTDNRNNPVSQQEDGTIIAGEDRVNKIVGDQKIKLEVDDIAGEAIYFDLIDTTTNNPVTLENNRLYRGGVDLSVGDDKTRSYKIRTYAISYGIRSKKVEYNIVLTADRHDVKLYPAGGAQGEEPLIYQYHDGDKVTISANVPDDSRFSYWSVLALSQNGHIEGSDIGYYVLGPTEYKELTATFTMPRTGDKVQPNSGFTFGDAYGLQIKPVLSDKIKRVRLSTNSPGPVQGEIRRHEFAYKTDITFDDGSRTIYDHPVYWTYLNKDGQQVLVPDGQKEVYDDTVYILTTVIPKDDIHEFAKDIIGLYKSWPADEGRVDEIEASRNEADGSVTVNVKFIPTEDSGEHPQPDVKVLSVGLFDTDQNKYIQNEGLMQYFVEPGSSVSFAAPIVEDNTFLDWEVNNDKMDRSGDNIPMRMIIKLDIPEDYDPIIGDIADVDAQYVPVINKVEAEIDDPAGQKELSGKKKLYLTSADKTYEVREDCIDVSWSPDIPEGEKAKHMISYTAEVHTVQDKLGRIWFREVDDSRKPLEDYRSTGIFYYADNTEAVINGFDAFAYVDDNIACSVSYVFPETLYKLAAVYRPDDITDVPHSCDNEEAVKALLPESLTIMTDSGEEMKAPVTWDLTQGEHEDEPGRRDAVVWTAEANVDLEALQTVEDKDHVLDDPVTVNIYVNEAETARSPESSLDSGEYLNNKIAVLTTDEEGGTTYYTTDGSDPKGSSRKKYEGETIEVSFDHDKLVDGKTFVLRAYTVKEGMWDSAEVLYGYTFTDEVNVPEGESNIYTGREQIGVAGSDFYEIVSVDGGRVDENGDSVAVEEGTYNAVVRIRNGYKWKLENGSTTTDDQTVSFSILPDITAPFEDGKTIEVAEEALSKMSSDADPAGTVFRQLRAKSSKQGRNNVKLSWAKVTGADKYYVYGAKCGGKNKFKRLASVKGTSRTIKALAGKNLKKGTYYKFMVIAVDDEEIIRSSSKIVHAATKGGKVGNYKAVRTKAKKNKVTLKKGKKFKLSASAVKQSKKLKVRKHRTIMYESENTKIASVSAKGVIKAKEKGKCYVYAYAQNGVYKKVKVTVK